MHFKFVFCFLQKNFAQRDFSEIAMITPPDLRDGLQSTNYDFLNVILYKFLLS